MKINKINKINRIQKLLGKTNIVGVINSVDDLRSALRHPDSFDIAEWRVDECVDESVWSGLLALNKPVIITVRAASEGGCDHSWGPAERMQLYRRYMQTQLVAFIDIELSTAVDFQSLINEAHDMGVGVITSYHDFKRTVSGEGFGQLHSKFIEIHGDILKIAATPANMHELIEFERFALYARERFQTPIAAMAMKEYGRLSRVLEAKAGAPLVYCSIDAARVTGQWKADTLKKLLADL
ncbi:MAG: type I 3-dehydroquinate dehydratase [bacterium]